MDSIKHYFMKEDSSMEDLGSGISRNILSYSDNLMLVEVYFEKGAVGSLHSHPHEQCTYILEGVFEFNIGGKKQILKVGDSTYKQPNVEHGAVCLETGRLLDVFTPARQTFLET
ncbi:cupin domain-containing protein [Vallitalea pronyensis]|nr:cupin domain-containing protein [Vallitalea pronyensis]